MNTILILGGGGFIGSNLAELFVSNGENVIVFGKKESDYQNLNFISHKIKIIKGDFNNSEIIEKIFDENQIDIVVHLISSIIPATPFNEIIENTELVSTIKLLDIMHKKSVEKIIFFSSGGAVYGVNGEKINREDSPTDPVNFHGWLKLTIESYIQMCNRTHGLNYMILRASNIYGKKQNINGNQGLIAVALGRLLKNKPIEVWGDGEIVRDYIYIDDLCRALTLLIQNNRWNDIYNIGSGRGTSVNKILQIIKKVSGIEFDINYQKGRKIDVPFNILDTSKLKGAIPLGNLTDLEDGIKKYWEELKR